MSTVLFASHNDDETLFASFLCLREKPHVIVCLNAGKERTAETARAMKILDCTWESWDFAANDPAWDSVRAAIFIQAGVYENCIAPAPAFERNSHDPDKPTPTGFGVLQHDRIGQFALEAFGPERFTGYHTYTRYGGKTTAGVENEPEPEWVLLKLRALACYESQIRLPATMPHFVDTLREYIDAVVT